MDIASSATPVLSALIVSTKAVADKCANKEKPGTLPKECAQALSILQAASFAEIQHYKAESFPRCQCCLWRVSFSDLEGASNLFGNHNSS